MSLISARNLVAPFTNRVHLVTILLVALLFGIFRWADGSVRMNSRGSLERENQRAPRASSPRVEGLRSDGSVTIPGEEYDPQSEIARLGGEKVSAPGTSKRVPNRLPEGKNEERDLVGDFIGRGKESESRTEGQSGKGKPPANDLSEIEKSLGIR